MVLSQEKVLSFVFYLFLFLRKKSIFPEMYCHVDFAVTRRSYSYYGYLTKTLFEAKSTGHVVCVVQTFCKLIFPFQTGLYRCPYVGA